LNNRRKENDNGRNIFSFRDARRGTPFSLKKKREEKKRKGKEIKKEKNNQGPWRSNANQYRDDGIIFDF